MTSRKQLWLILLVTIFFTSCPSSPEPVEDDPPIQNNTETIQEPVDPNPDQEPEIIPDDPEVVEPVPDPVDPDSTEPEIFEVTEEQYQTTFADIESLITTLNQVIRRRDFEQWITYLDEIYIETMGSEEKLAPLNERPILQQAGIQLKDLNDFFNFVVVPSRSNAKLDEIVFLDNNHVTAYMYNNGDPEARIILYQLVYDGERWKITLW